MSPRLESRGHYFMNKILKNKKFGSIKEIHFTPELKKRLWAVLGDKKIKRAEEISKKIDGFQFTYLSAGRKISGLLALPKSRAGKKFPCIIYNRGGNKNFGTLRHGALFNNLGFLAVEGYVVIASQYSGNNISEWKDEYGGRDINDIIALHEILKTIPFVDMKKIGMYGGSRGGMMTFLVMIKVKWIKAVCIKSGLYNLVRNVELRPEMKKVFKEAFGGSKKEMVRRSVEYWADKVPKNIPILMLHGSSDWRSSPIDALETSKKFIKYKVPHRLVLFEGADHFLTEFSEEENSLTISWFNKYLKNGESLPNPKPHGA